MQPLSHFEQMRPSILGHAVTNHFKRDLGEARATAIVLEVLGSNQSSFEELHKFEEKVQGNFIFRAKIAGKHIVYAVSASKMLVFLRGFSNFSEYRKYLDDKQGLKAAIEGATE